jgi:hypothetical protein
MEYLTRDEVWLLRAGLEKLIDDNLRRNLPVEKSDTLWHKLLNILDTKQEIIKVQQI